MKCPACDDELRALRLMEGIQVDICGGCKGMWLDPGEASVLTDLKQDVPDIDEALDQARETARECPRCGRFMEEIDFAGGEPAIDRCPSCRGLFLDKGEQKSMEEAARRIELTKSGFFEVIRQVVPGHREKPELRDVDLDL